MRCESCHAEKLVAFSYKRRGFCPSCGGRRMAETAALVQMIAEPIGRSLERAGLITRDIDNAYLAFDPSEHAPIHTLLGHSITYRIATGPREGHKVFTLQTLPPDPERSSADVAENSGFSLHAGVSAKGGDRNKLEHLARYIGPGAGPHGSSASLPSRSSAAGAAAPDSA